MTDATCRTYEQEIGGRKLTIETGALALQAQQAVTVHYGDTVVLVTLGVAPEPREGVDFLPLTIDYEERLYAAGKIPGGFIRREGRPSQEATLAARLTDRAIRPLLPKTWRREVQLIVTVLSVDQENDPDILALVGTSAVLHASEVPFYGPIGAVRVGYINDQLVLNPTLAQLDNSLIDLVVASSKDKIVMVEAGAREAEEDIVLRAIKFAHEANQAVIALQEGLAQSCGKPKVEVPPNPVKPEVLAAVQPLMAGKVEESLRSATKAPRDKVMDDTKKAILATLGEQFAEEDIAAAIEEHTRIVIRASLLQGKRAGGRRLDEVRPVSCQVGLLPRTHGSGLFTRGETQVLTITTLGSKSMEQKLDGLGIEENKRFIHHYNMPPFSTGEVKRIGTPGRREIGHGALVERSLLPVIPKEEDFPYTLRLVSEVLSSSGSTSMASACASSLSLLDAGVPIKRPVAGVATGLVTDDTGRFELLTDIEGLEDAYGDMDFKIAGTTVGITGVQMDTKLKGLTMEIVEKTLISARQSRLFILNIMGQTISTARPELSRYAPRMYRISIPPEKIGSVIGPGGKTIRAIIEETKTTIDIEDDGTVVVGSPDEAAARKAIGIIEDMTREVEVGTVYTGKVTRIMPFGAIVQILPGKDGMVHISELADFRVANVEDVVKIGDEVTVKVIRVEDGKVALSRKAVLAPSSEGTGTGGASGESRPPRRDYPPRSSDRPRSPRPPMSGPSRGPRPPRRDGPAYR